MAIVIHQPFPIILPKITWGTPELLQVPDKLMKRGNLIFLLTLIQKYLNSSFQQN